MDTTQKTKLTKQNGQISVFLAVIVVLAIALMAFIINIGIFVKSKINLQNAVDAAAYSGAAVQARQLTEIGYMNWEMRNIYKEWMYKYYVLGHLGLTDTKRSNILDGGMDFRLPPTVTNAGSVLAGRENYNRQDPFNIPSVCITYANSFNICDTYVLPGLPRFESLGLPGIDETHNAFVKNLVEQKSKDCSSRSKVNFTVARQWSYGIFDPNVSAALPANAPRIALDKMGAFPKALEAAIRVRNMERIVNEPPKNSIARSAQAPICNELGGCRPLTELESLSATYDAPIHERTIKAFWAGYRNLAKSPDGEPNNMKDNFVLTEISPTPLVGNDFDSELSFYLMKQTTVNGYNSSEKHYLDLKPYLLNLSIFYTLFASDEGQGGANTPTTQAECGATKVAIPVPGYPLGFVKNPNLVTYYAVKGETYFTGLLNPFLGPIRMVAYGAAKPFGGKIGPQIFNTGGTDIKPREKYSFSYLSGLNIPSPNYKLGFPLPFDQIFWVDSGTDSVIGGTPSASSASTKFAIPNLPYDFTTSGASGFATGSESMESINQNTIVGAGGAQNIGGLYSRSQFFKFKGSDILNTNLIGDADIDKAIYRMYAPTGYEAGNYLIPTLEKHNKAQQVSSVGFIPSLDNDSAVLRESDPLKYNIYAPIFGDGLLYSGPGDLKDLLERYINQNKGAIDLYLNSLKEVAQGMIDLDNAGGGGKYVRAAATIHEGNNLTCSSIAGNFSQFFFGNINAGSDCPEYLVSTIIDYWQQRIGEADGVFKNYYNSPYIAPQDVSDSGAPENDNQLGIKKYMTGYLPGTKHGANPDTGSGLNPFSATGDTASHRRNFYSVKLIPLQSLRGAGATSYQNDGFSLYAESMRSNSYNGPPDILTKSFQNPVNDPQELEEVFQ